jgi:hypothetical protein
MGWVPMQADWSFHRATCAARRPSLSIMGAVGSLYRLEPVALRLGAVLALMAIAGRILIIPYPIFLGLCGVVLGFVPGAPHD